MTEKLALYKLVWNKYLPVIRILLKKSATGEQVLDINRIDFDKVSGIKKAGYRFTVNFINNNPDGIFSSNDLIQAFITTLQSDVIIQGLLSESNYSFVFTSKYRLQIINNGLHQQAVQPSSENEIL